MRFKEYLRSHWSGCRLLHEGVDPYRNRKAKYFAIPGEFSIIGYSDETDSFVVPVSPYVPEPVRTALQAIREGRPVPPVAPTRARRVLREPSETTTRVRRHFHG